jgi:hypothetical protein
VDKTDISWGFLTNRKRQEGDPCFLTGVIGIIIHLVTLYEDDMLPVFPRFLVSSFGSNCTYKHPVQKVISTSKFVHNLLRIKVVLAKEM